MSKNFDSLSNDLILYIFRYLPMKDVVRISSVCQKFNGVSKTLIAGTTVLHLEAPFFKKLNADQLAGLLDLCSSKLKEIKLDTVDKVYRFSKYSCPKLTSVVIFGPYVLDELRDIVRQNKNLKTLVLSKRQTPEPRRYQLPNVDPIFIFPDVIAENLQALKVIRCDNDSLLSLTGRVPSLQAFSTKLQKIETHVAEEFFASVPELKEVDILESSDTIQDPLYANLTTFWSLPLTKLTLYGASDASIVIRIVNSFPLLEHLQLGSLSMPTTHTLETIATLKNLRILYLDGYRIGNKEDDILLLTRCRTLQKAAFPELRVTVENWIKFVRMSPPTLAYFCARNIYGIATFRASGVYPAKPVAEDVMEQLHVIGPRSLTIVIMCMHRPPAGCCGEYSNWESAAMREAVKKLKENGGPDIKIVDFFGKQINR